MGALVLGAVAIASAIAVAVVAGEGLAADTQGPPAYVIASPLLSTETLTAGLALIAAGLAAATQERTRRLGLLALVAALGWLVPELQAWANGPDVVQSVAIAATPLVAVVLLALARAPRAALAAVAAAAAAFGVIAVTLRDPFLDVYCWRSCSGNVLLIHAAPDLVRTVSVACTVAVAGLGVGVAALAVRRRPRTPLLLAAGVAGLAESAYAVALLHTPLEDPELAGFAAIHAARAVALVLLAGAVALALFELLRTRARVARLATELGEAPTPGRLRDALAIALRDPALDVLYWLPGSQRFVDAGGVEREPPDDRRGTRITRGGRPLAILVHDLALSEGRDLAGEIGSATRLAIENEVLRAEVLAQLTELRQSRIRIVETGDAARRRLERDLHDGAQQQLLAVVLELRLARARAAGELASRLEAAGAEVDRAFAELREIAHGIYPAALTDGGLGAALTELAVTAPVAVEVGDVPGERFAPGVETSAYVAVAEAIRDAAERGATVVAVGARQTGDRLVVNVSDDGDARVGGLVHVADRVGAVGGELEIGRAGLRAEIPCAS